jgi:release factor glutamine methyltransferase
VTALEKLRELAQNLEREGLSDAAREAELLLTAILKISKAELHSFPPDIPDAESREIDTLASRRIQGEPLQYIIGHVEFWGLRIHVGKGVLIPRPETELLVEETIKIVEALHEKPLRILDLCTGSGCIALSLAKSIPGAYVYGIDKSALALSFANRNAEENGIRNIRFIQGDLFAPVGPDAEFDCIVSNPPYIRRADIPALQREIAFEPVEALDGGADGLDFYRKILTEAPRHLRQNGLLVLESGFDQSEDIRKLAIEAGFRDIHFIKDYAGIYRIFVGRYQRAM